MRSAGPGPRVAGRPREEAAAPGGHPAGLHQDQFGAGAVVSGQHRHHPDPVRGHAARHHRAGVVLPLLRRAPGLLRPVRHHDRRRAQHDPRQRPYRDAARRVPEPRAAAPGALRRTAAAAGRAPALQRRAGREGRPAGLFVAVQVGVPGQHVARAAHAAQLDADLRAAAGRQRAAEPLGGGGDLRHQHPPLRLRPVAAHQRHPRPVEGGGQAVSTSAPRSCRWPRCSTT